jgi:hypothetical protein
MPRSAAPGARGRLPAAALMLAVLSGLATGAGASPLADPPAAPTTWLTKGAAQALQVAERQDSLHAGAATLLNQSFAHAFGELRRHAPHRLTGLDLRLELREDFSARYELRAAQTLLSLRTAGARVLTEGRLAHDPAGHTIGQLGLRYHGSLASEPITLGLHSSLEDRWLSDYQRRAVDAELSSFPLVLKARLYDDVPGARLRTDRIPDRRLDGYQLQLDLRLPDLPWAQLCARQAWQIPVDSEQPSHADRLSLRIQPLGPLQLEAGTSGTAVDRAWFARVELKVSLGGS